MSEPTDQALRDAFQALADRPAAPPCVSAEEIYDAVAGDLPPERVAGVVDHVSACPECAEAWRLAMAIVEEEPASRVIPLFAAKGPVHDAFPEARASAWKGWPVLGGLALAAVAVFVVGPAVLAPPSEEPVYRDGADASLQTASPTVLVPRLAGDVPLAWSGAPEGSTYDIVVTDMALRTVAEARGLTSPAWNLPAEHVIGLAPGAALLWRVEATTPSGEKRASPTWRIALE